MNTQIDPVSIDDDIDESDETHLIETVKIDNKFSVKHRLEQLKAWADEYQRRDLALQQRQRSLHVKSRIDRQIGAAIARQRRRLRILLAQNPLELVTDGLDAEKLLSLRESLLRQFAGLTKQEQLLWLNNFEFIMTPDLKGLFKKLNRIRSYRSLGQQRGLLVGGPSGMGKTTCVNALLMMCEPEITNEVTVVPIVKVDAPANNKSPRTLYRRIINSFGLSYSASDSEEDLTETAIAFLDACQVELLIIDEIEHIKDHELKRKILDLSNQTRGIPIICVSCNPMSWTEDDEEIKGRWNDYFPLERYDQNKLGALLTYLEILLPFSEPSRLDEFVIDTADNKNMEGPASFIYKVTKGILRDVMILVRDASREAIIHNHTYIYMTTLEKAWKKIQEKPNPRVGETEDSSEE